jgi:hypothetical protein
MADLLRGFWYGAPDPETREWCLRALVSHIGREYSPSACRLCERWMAWHTWRAEQAVHPQMEGDDDALV